MRNDKFRITDLILEKYILGELSAKEVKIVEEQLLQERGLKERLEYLKKSNNDILKQYPAEKIVPEITKKYEQAIQQESWNKKEKYSISKILKYAVPAFSLAIILFFVLPVFYEQIFHQEHIRIKGSTELYIYRKKGNIEERLKYNDVARQGDIIQLAYMSGDQQYGVIFSLDSRGNITLHFPSNKNENTRLTLGKLTLLKESYELDDAPRYEIFFFISSKKKTDAHSILNIADQLKIEPDKAEQKSRILFQKWNILQIKIKKR